MVFQNLATGTRVRLANSIPHLRCIRVGWEGEVTEIMRSFAEIRWEGELGRTMGRSPETRCMSLRLALSYLDCESLEVVRKKKAGNA